MQNALHYNSICEEMRHSAIGGCIYEISFNNYLVNKFAVYRHENKIIYIYIC